MVLNISVMFCENISDGFQVTDPTLVYHNSKVGKPQSWFLFPAHSRMVLNISVTFCENISDGFQVTDPTLVYDQNHYLMFKGL